LVSPENRYSPRWRSCRRFGADKKPLEAIDFNLVDKSKILPARDLVTPYSASLTRYAAALISAC
jgi:hypothetical protein